MSAMTMSKKKEVSWIGAENNYAFSAMKLHQNEILQMMCFDSLTCDLLPLHAVKTAAFWTNMFEQRECQVKTSQKHGR